MAYTTLISAPALMALTALAADAANSSLLVIDCSFDLTDPTLGQKQYLQTHIPGALYANLNTALSAHDASAASGGRHPLPSRQAFANWLTSLGVRHTTQVVVYDRNGANYCGRLWWMLKWVGHTDVAVLDGGLQGWVAAGGALESDEPTRAAVPAPTEAYALRPSSYRLLDAAEVEAGLGRPSQTLIDARGAPRFRGEVEPLDPVAGHIPGALNRPFTANLTADGTFKPAAQLKAEFETLLGGRDASSVVHHCGSGVSALPNLIAMEVAGLGQSALYAGSWSDWCSHTAYPVARG